MFNANGIKRNKCTEDGEENKNAFVREGRHGRIRDVRVQAHHICTDIDIDKLITNLMFCTNNLKNKTTTKMSTSFSFLFSVDSQIDIIEKFCIRYSLSMPFDLFEFQLVKSFAESPKNIRANMRSIVIITRNDTERVHI